MKVINYACTDKLKGSYYPISPDSCFNKDGVSYPPERLTNAIDEKNLYVDCPVWSHKAHRIFLIKSPIQIEFITKITDTESYLSFTQKSFIKDHGVIFLENNQRTSWVGNGNPVVQLNIPTYTFWSKYKNIWIEIRPHPYTAVNNNFVTIGGWWNLSNWTRPTSFGLQIVNVEKPVTINRGDPIFEVCFYSNDLNDDFKMVKQEFIPDDIMNQVARNTNIKMYIRNLSQKFLFQKQKESKCPFAFLFNK